MGGFGPLSLTWKAPSDYFPQELILREGLGQWWVGGSDQGGGMPGVVLKKKVAGWVGLGKE